MSCVKVPEGVSRWFTPLGCGPGYNWIFIRIKVQRGEVVSSLQLHFLHAC